MLRIIVFCFLSLTFLKEQPTQNWSSNYRLQWHDFKGEARVNSDAVAVTASGLSFSYSTIKSNRGDLKEFNYTIEAQFYPEESWYKKEQVNTHILEHERLHFDITELFARKMRKRIESSYLTKNIDQEINRIYGETRLALSEMQKQYDSETSHSQRLENQLKWQRFIKQELLKLAAYSS
ncbi:MAG: DUF922 domain-containing protein [Flavobacteriaceae bacterium]|nr:DUF922 domain-containing protein [Flavobacteriaceae bacterium]